MRIAFKPGWPEFMRGFTRDLELAGLRPSPTPIRLPTYTVTTLPPAANWPAGLAYVSNETGGATIAFSDGTNWRRVQDRAVVS